MLLAHGPIGTLFSYLGNKKEFSEFGRFEKSIFIFFTFFFGILPDLDMIYLILIGRSGFSHHDLITHTPIFWIVVSIVLFLGTSGAKSKYRKVYITSFLISTIFHVLADTLTGHIRLLYPFNTTFYTLFGDVLPDNIFAGYTTNPIFTLEITILFIYLLFLLKNLLKINFKWILVFPILFAIFNSYIYIQTYQTNIYEKNPDHSDNADMDRDNILDIYDWDVNNNGIDNFKDSNIQQRSEYIDKIINSKKEILPQQRNFRQEVLYHFGGLTVQRVIFQILAQTHNYIYPVINEYMYINNKKGFSSSVFDYLISTEKFKVNIAPQKGSIVILEQGDERFLGIMINEKELLFDDGKNNVVVKSIQDIKEYTLRIEQ